MPRLLPATSLALLALVISPLAHAQDVTSPESLRPLPKLAPLTPPPPAPIKNLPEWAQDKIVNFEVMLMIYAAPEAKASQGYEALNDALHKAIRRRVSQVMGGAHVFFGMRPPEAKISVGVTVEIREFAYAPAESKESRGILVAHIVGKNLNNGQIVTDTLFDSRADAYSNAWYNSSDHQLEELVGAIADAVDADPGFGLYRYVDQWIRQVEHYTNAHYPPEALQHKPHAPLQIRVLIHKDGSLGQTEIVHSSGDADLDKAALRMVREAGPYTSPPVFRGTDGAINAISIMRTLSFGDKDEFTMRAGWGNSHEPSAEYRTMPE